MGWRRQRRGWLQWRRSLLAGRGSGGGAVVPPPEPQLYCRSAAASGPPVPRRSLTVTATASTITLRLTLIRPPPLLPSGSRVSAAQASLWRGTRAGAGRRRAGTVTATISRVPSHLSPAGPVTVTMHVCVNTPATRKAVA